MLLSIAVTRNHVESDVTLSIQRECCILRAKMFAVGWRQQVNTCKENIISFTAYASKFHAVCVCKNQRESKVMSFGPEYCPKHDAI